MVTCKKFAIFYITRTLFLLYFCFCFSLVVHLFLPPMSLRHRHTRARTHIFRTYTSHQTTTHFLFLPFLLPFFLSFFLIKQSKIVLAAEVVHSYLPRIVELHNYSAANSVTQKEYNWKTLNDKVFRRFGYQLSSDDIEQIVRARPGVIERTLLNMKTKLEGAKQSGGGVRSAGSKRAGSKQSQHGQSVGVDDVGQQRGGRRERQAAPVREQRQSKQQMQQQQFTQQNNYDIPRGGGGGGNLGMPAHHQQQQQHHQQQQQQQQQQRQQPYGAQQAMYPQTLQKEVDQEMLEEKEQEVQELRETIDILELKVKKLEQLVRLKDSKIQALTSKLNGGM